MHTALRSTIWALVTVVAAACPAEDEGDDDAAGTSAAPTSGATDGSGSATSTTMGPIDDPEAFCASRSTQRECDYFDEAANVYCAWWSVTPVTVTNGTCELGDPVGGCLAMTGGTTAAGCGPPPGCDGEPWYRDVDGVIHVSMQCGGSPPVGYEPCTYVEPGVFDPPECTCLCDEPIDPSTSTGG